MTEAMPFLQKYDITFLRPPPIKAGAFLCGEAEENVSAIKMSKKRVK